MNIDVSLLVKNINRIFNNVLIDSNSYFQLYASRCIIHEFYMEEKQQQQRQINKKKI